MGDKVLITECYGPGAALLKVSPGKAEPVWTDKERDRRPQPGVPLEYADLCRWLRVRLQRSPRGGGGAAAAWSGDRQGHVGRAKRLSRASLTRIDGHFLCLTERGELLLLKVNPTGIRAGRQMGDGLDYPSWAAPVVAHGLMYLRGKDRPDCAELIPGKQ